MSAVLPYMVNIYSILVRAGRRAIESLPEEYQVPVAELLATKNEAVSESV
ncbi:CD1375 family protein [Heliobacterium mobile]|nr:CD1375 family protein [Heliobacterium mobile]